jgi:hypothetical protein
MVSCRWLGAQAQYIEIRCVFGPNNKLGCAVSLRMKVFFQGCFVALLAGLLGGCLAAAHTELGYEVFVFWLWFTLAGLAGFFVTLLVAGCGCSPASAAPPDVATHGDSQKGSDT